MLLETKNLYIKKAEVLNKLDINFIVNLFNNPEVMKYVGFPKGLGTTFEKEKNNLQKKYNTDDAILLILKKDKNQKIGSCKIGIPNEDKFCEIDYKLLPNFQGKGYGSEILQGLAEFIFKIKKYRGIKTDPNIDNIASQKICEKIGMKRTGQGIFSAPSNNFMEDVHYYIYEITIDEYFYK
jgi:RimJ/RimL family protein N-acetyltransferase